MFVHQIKSCFNIFYQTRCNLATHESKSLKHKWFANFLFFFFFSPKYLFTLFFLLKYSTNGTFNVNPHGKIPKEILCLVCEVWRATNKKPHNIQTRVGKQFDWWAVNIDRRGKKGKIKGILVNINQNFCEF